MKTVYIILIHIITSLGIIAQWNFQTSLHKQRSGFAAAYSINNGGMENITSISICDLSCKKCHSLSGLYANGTPIDPLSYQPVCVDCHDFQTSLTVSEEACLSCHIRQKKEKELYPDMDVHSNAEMNCTSCHSAEELHGDDAVSYSSMREYNAVKIKCSDCHSQLSNNAYHNQHLASVDCSACHAVTVYSCGGCHFETYLETGKKRFNNEFRDYRLLVKKEGIVHLGSINTHSFNGKSNYIIASTHSHIIARNAVSCSDCHRAMGNVNQAIQEYNETGFISLVKWDPVEKKMDVMHAVIPLTADWEYSLITNHVTYSGDPAIFPSDPDKWTYLKSESDNAHLYYAEPLDSSTLQKLGVNRFPVSVRESNSSGLDFQLFQNYPNPFNPSTNIRYSISSPVKVVLKVYDALGNEVRTLINEEKPAGVHLLNFDASDISSGVYFYSIQSGSNYVVRKMILIK